MKGNSMVNESDIEKCQNLKKELQKWFDTIPEECKEPKFLDDCEVKIINLNEEPVPENGMLVFTYDNKQLDDFYSYLYMLNK